MLFSNKIFECCELSTIQVVAGLEHFLILCLSKTLCLSARSADDDFTHHRNLLTLLRFDDPLEEGDLFGLTDVLLIRRLLSVGTR